MRDPTSETTSSPGGDPAEGPPEMELPGADHADPMPERQPGDAPNPGDPEPHPEPPDSPADDLPQRLGERIGNGPGTGIRAGEPDLVPDVEVPEETM
jgi:hypothetical protein